MYHATLTEFCRRYALPDEALQSLRRDLDALLAGPDGAAFARTVYGYTADPDWDYQTALAQAAQMTACGAHSYAVQALFCIALLPEAKRRWLAAGVPEDVFYDSMADLSYKLIECKKLHGVWGIFVAFWFDLWYECRRFALGRLQFELVKAAKLPFLGDGVTVHGVHVAPEDTVINVHIPSSGHLPHEAVLDAYRRAVRFFAPQLNGHTPVFVCFSGLLWPQQERFLPAHCNVLPFLRDFTILGSYPDGGANLWRLFYIPYRGDPQDIPVRCSADAAWKQWLTDGGLSGVGSGILIWNSTDDAPYPRDMAVHTDLPARPPEEH